MYNYSYETIRPFLVYLNDHAIIRYALIVAILMTLGLLVLLYNSQQKKSATSAADVSAIAGDDVLATQLDLAKAYLEMDQKILAKPLLKQILKDGKREHKERARLLMKTL
jgi:FimV-like protein